MLQYDFLYAYQNTPSHPFITQDMNTFITQPKMPIIIQTQDGKTVNAMTQTTDLFFQQTKQSWEQQVEIDQHLAPQLHEMEVARAKAQYQLRQDQISRNNDKTQHCDKTKCEIHTD